MNLESEFMLDMFQEEVDYSELPIFEDPQQTTDDTLNRTDPFDADCKC